LCHEIEYLDAEKVKSSGVTLKQLEDIENASKKLYSEEVVRRDLTLRGVAMRRI
jgi:hypothetical protein